MLPFHALRRTRVVRIMLGATVVVVATGIWGQADERVPTAPLPSAVKGLKPKDRPRPGQPVNSPDAEANRAAGPEGLSQSQAAAAIGQMMHTFDRDGDGQLNRTEIAGAHAALAKLRQKSSSFEKLQLEQFVQHYDVNGNHRLDPDETRQLLADWKLPGVAFPPLTGYGDLESAMGINHGLLRRFDRNRDGRLDEAEKDAARRMIRPPQRDNRVEGPARRPN